MSPLRPATTRTASSKASNLDKIDELSVADLSINEEDNESELKTNAQNALDAAREKLNEKKNATKTPIKATLSAAGLPMKAGTSVTRAGTRLSGRDGTSMVPAATKLTGHDYASMVPSSTRLSERDNEPTTNFKSMRPQGTLLHNRDYFASMVPGTRLTDRDIQSVLPDQDAVDKFTEITGIPKSFAPSSKFIEAEFLVPSAIKTSDDAVKAVQQIYFKELTDAEQEEQLQWVENILKTFDPCPQGRKVSFPAASALPMSFSIPFLVWGLC